MQTPERPELESRIPTHLFVTCSELLKLSLRLQFLLVNRATIYLVSRMKYCVQMEAWPLDKDVQGTLPASHRPLLCEHQVSPIRPTLRSAGLSTPPYQP